MKTKRIRKYRKLREVRPRELAEYLLLPILVAAAALVACLTATDGMTAAIALTIATLALLLRSFAVGLIKLYQAFAPLSLRRRCRYVPSCSAYTLCCIKRFGLVIGLYLGLRRIWWCRPPYGGEDEPPLSLRLKKKNI